MPIIGPCGAKTTAIGYLKEELTKRGYDVYTVPEAATLIVVNGGKYPGFSVEKKPILIDYENTMMQFRLHLEETMNKIAKSQHKRRTVVLYDRGLLDHKAYVTQDMWDELLKINNITEENILARYDLACHLVTAADGAEEFYTIANNIARTEDVEDARRVDQRTREAWSNHPDLHVFDNHKPLKSKLQNLLETVDSYVQKTN